VIGVQFWGMSAGVLGVAPLGGECGGDFGCGDAGVVGHIAGAGDEFQGLCHLRAIPGEQGFGVGLAGEAWQDGTDAGVALRQEPGDGVGR
jgi:hypothetical protein